MYKQMLNVQVFSVLLVVARKTLQPLISNYRAFMDRILISEINIQNGQLVQL